MKPFWTISQMSTLDGSPKLERQVRKITSISVKLLFLGPEVLTPGFTENSGDEGLRIFPALQEHRHQDLRNRQRRHLHPDQVRSTGESLQGREALMMYFLIINSSCYY